MSTTKKRGVSEMRNIKGKVTMDLSEYNRLMTEVEKYKNLLYVDYNGYGTYLRVKINHSLFKEEVEKILEDYPEAELIEDWFHDWSKPSFTIANLPEKEESND